MNAKHLVPLFVVGALLVAGCTAPQEAGDNDTNNTSVTCPSDLNNASNNSSSDGADASDDVCPDMVAPTPGTSPGGNETTTGNESANETNATNTTSSYP